MSMDELAKHCKPGDYFIALYGQIIDVSNFILKHPGGEKILKANAGKDATQKFESIWVFAFVIAFFILCSLWLIHVPSTEFCDHISPVKFPLQASMPLRVVST